VRSLGCLLPLSVGEDEAGSEADVGLALRFRPPAPEESLLVNHVDRHVGIRELGGVGRRSHLTPT
jgi:hypothetical protein